MMLNSKFSLGRAAGDIQWRFTDASKPFFHKGNEIGCIVQHGFTGTPANMRVVSEALAEAGFTVIAPLLTGHRTTMADMERYTRDDWRRDVRAAYDRLRAEGCKKIFAIGLSMGGLLSADLAETVPVDGVVLMCTPFRMKRQLVLGSFLYPLCRFVAFTHIDSPSVDPDHEMYYGAPIRGLAELRLFSREVRKGLKRINCPTLIIQARLDKRVDIPAVERAAAAIASHPDVVYLENSPHGCTYGPERDLAARLVADFVLAHSGIDNAPPVDL